VQEARHRALDVLAAVGLLVLGRLGEVDANQGWQQRFVLGANHTEHVDHAYDAARRERAPGESKTKDPILGLTPVSHQEAVSLGNVVVDAAARGQARDSISLALHQVDQISRRGRIRRAYAGVIEQDCVRQIDMTQVAIQQEDIGVLDAAGQGVVGAVAADDEVSGDTGRNRRNRRSE
jgi:hypothetical protein